MKPISFAVLIVVTGVFLPKVLDSFEAFLLTFFAAAGRLLEGIPALR